MNYVFGFNFNFNFNFSHNSLGTSGELGTTRCFVFWERRTTYRNWERKRKQPGGGRFKIIIIMEGMIDCLVD